MSRPTRHLRQKRTELTPVDSPGSRGVGSTSRAEGDVEADCLAWKRGPDL